MTETRDTKLQGTALHGSTLPQHHIPATLLLDYAAGSLPEAWALAVACHLTFCPSCRAELRAMEAAGGGLLDQAAPAELKPGSLDAVLARLEPGSPDAAPGLMPGQAYRAQQQAGRPAGRQSGQAPVPRPLAAYLPDGFDNLPWRWSGAGLHALPLALPKARGGMASLLRIAPGAAMPVHGHAGEELTLVLSGGFTDERGAFRQGDVEYADGSVQHRPVAMADRPCICLAVTDAPLRFSGPFGWFFNQWARLAS